MLGIVVNEVQRSLTGIGEAPNDFEASRDLCYLPVREQWFYDGTHPQYPTPLGPSGDVSKDLDYRVLAPRSRGYAYSEYTPYGSYSAYSHGLRGNDLGATLGDAVEELNKLNKRLFWLQALSTASILTLASLAVVKAVRDNNKKSLLGENAARMRTPWGRRL